MASQPEAQRQIDRIEEFVTEVRLKDIVCFEERARVLHWSEGEIPENDLPQVDNALALMSRPGRLMYRFRCLYTDFEAEYVADWGAEYEYPPEISVSSDVVNEFAERVAFFAIYPYLRASVYSSASRLNKPIPVLPMVQQGEFERGDAMTEEATEHMFGDHKSERIRR